MWAAVLSLRPDHMSRLCVLVILHHLGTCREATRQRIHEDCLFVSPWLLRDLGRDGKRSCSRPPTDDVEVVAVIVSGESRLWRSLLFKRRHLVSLYCSIVDTPSMSVSAVLVSPKSLLDSITAFELLTRPDDGQPLRGMQIPSTLCQQVIVIYSGSL